MAFKKAFFTFVLGISVMYVFGQSKLDSLQHIEEVTIRAFPFKEIIPVQKMDAGTIDKLNSHSVADALRYFSGVQIKDYGGMGGLKTVNVRSMGTHHTGVFYDGIQLGNAQNGQVDLGKFSLDDMEEISLYNGQKSDVFQSAKDYASASAVYLRSKRPKFKSGEKTRLSFRFKTGSIQLVNPSFRWEQKLTDKLNLSLSSEYLHSDGKYKFRYKRVHSNGETAYDTTARRQGGDIEAYRIESGLYGELAGGYWESKVYYYDSERGLPGAVVRNVFYNGQRLWDKNFFAQTDYRKELNSRYRFQVKGKYAYDYTRFLDENLGDSIDGQPGLNGNGINNYYYQQELYLSTVHKYNVYSWLELSLAADFNWNKLNASGTGIRNFSYPQRYTGLLAPAIAVNWGKLKAQANLLGTFVHESVKENSKAPDKSELTPSVILGYKPFENKDLTFRAFYKRIFRMPTFNDLYYAPIEYTSLQPEFTTQYNVGFTFNKKNNRSFLDDISLQADVYYIKQTDKIVAAPTGSFFRWMMTNMGLVKTIGTDASAFVRTRINRVSVRGGVNYSYTQARDYTEPDKPTRYKGQIPYIPWHSGSFILTGDYEDWSLNYSFIYVGKRYNGAVDNIKKNELQPWYTHDLSVRKEINLKGYTVKGTIEVNNLLNQYYDVVLNYPMPGRNYRFIINVTL
jgi:Outer membrane cobalamin receptor protein